MRHLLVFAVEVVLRFLLNLEVHLVVGEDREGRGKKGNEVHTLETLLLAPARLYFLLSFCAGNFLLAPARLWLFMFFAPKTFLLPPGRTSASWILYAGT